MAISWTPLDLSASADANLPPLLISKRFEAASYEIHLTDLTHIWSESLDRTAILERAEVEITSIDPTESSQLEILLDKLALGLSSDPNTTLSLHIPSYPGRARPTISLSLTIKLPGGLAPLVWPIHLSAAPQSALTNQLTLPLLQAQHARKDEMEGLEEVLRDKDYVIQKLVDRLEIQGTDLGQIFPQVATRGGRKVDRKQVEEKVRGLRPFEMHVWKKGLGNERIENTAQLVQSIFTGGNSLGLPTRNVVGAYNWWESLKGSTIDLSTKSATVRTKTPSTPIIEREESTADDDFQVQETPAHLYSSPKASQSITLDDSTATDDEDLDAPSQRFQLPPSKSGKKLGKLGGKKGSSEKSSLASDSSTGDEEALLPKKAKKIGKLRGSKEAPPPIKDDSTDIEGDDYDKPLPSRPIKKFGKLGGKKGTSLPANVDSTGDEDESPKPAKKQQVDKEAPPSSVTSTDDTESIAPKPSKKRKDGPPVIDETPDEEDAPPKRSPRKSTSPEPVSKSECGPGTVRGRKKDPSPSLSPSPSMSTSDEAPKSKKGKLGRIGGRKKEATPTPSSSQNAPTPKRRLRALGGSKEIAVEENDAIDAADDKRGRSVKVEREKTPPRRETSEEKAEKRRAQLKRELEEKAKAPVKKKRKF